MQVIYSAKSAAVRAAKKALGPEAVAGQDFKVEPNGSGFIYTEISPVRQALKGAAPASGSEGPAETAQRAAKARSGKRATPTRDPADSASPRAAKGKRAEIEAAARNGTLPEPPDFSAETHKRYRPKLAELVAMVEAGDVKGLKAYEIRTVSSSPKAMDRFRNLAVMALEARQAEAI